MALFQQNPLPLLRYGCRILSIAVFVTNCGSVHALNPDYPIAKYVHHSWGSDSGLATVRNIAQTPDGYLWLATTIGLVRFDGVRFTTYTRAAGQSLDNCNVLMIDADGSLWAATFGGVIAHLESGKFWAYTWRDGLRSDYIHALYRDSNGILWVGTRDAGIFRMVHERFEKVSLALPPSFITGIAEDADRSLWIATFGNGMFRLQNGKVTSYSTRDGLPDNRVTRLYRDRIGTIWTSGWNGISSWNGNRFIRRAAPNATAGFANACLVDRDGNLWIASAAGLFRTKAGQVAKMDARSGLRANNVQYVYEDKEGDIWIAHESGLERLRDAPTRTFTVRDDLFPGTQTFQWPIVADLNSGVWTASDGRIGRVAAERVTTWPSTLPTGTRAYTMLVLPDSSLLVGFRDALRRWSPLQARWVTEFGGLDVRSLLRAHDGSIWMGTANRGLLHWKSYPELKANLVPVIADKSISTLAEDRDGTIWAGSHGGGLYRISEERIQHFGLKEGLPSQDIFTVFVDRSSALWVGSNGGLSWFQDGRIRTAGADQGLRSDLVLSILDDTSGRLWFLGHLGIGAIDEKSLHEWAAGQRAKLMPIFYQSAAGLTIWTVDRAFPTAVRSSDGHLWFAFGDGIAEVTPPNPGQHEPKFPVVVDDVLIDNISQPESGQIQIPPGARAVELRYTALTLSSPETVRFRYRLEGFDNDWTDADEKRVAYYSNLKPGTYTFRVEANAGGERWLESSPLFVEQIPFFYQTRWFLLLVSATALLLIFLSYRFRLRLAVDRIKAGFQQRIDERTRIARELHDTLLQSFQALMFQFQAARNMVPRRPEDAVHALDEAIAATSQAIAEGRDAISDLRPDSVTQHDLAELLNATGRELAAVPGPNGRSPSFRLVIEGKPRMIPVLLQDELHRIAREAIRNAFLHAGASHIETEIHYDRDQLRLRIRDDGKGMDPKIVAGGGRSGHWGIPGILERAKQIGARLQFWTEEGAGTEVELVLPAAAAYEKRRNGHRFWPYRRSADRGQRS